MNKLHRWVIIFLAVLILSGCTMPKTKIYSLYLPFEKNTHDDKLNASLSIVVRSPRYLSQPYIAFRSSPYQLEVSRYAKWDSAPSEMVRDAFRDSFSFSGTFKEVRASNLIPAGFHSLEIELRRFERLDAREGAEGDLAFGVTLISPEGKEIYHQDISKKFRLPDSSFLSLAQGLSPELLKAIEEVKTRTVKIISTGV